MNQNIEFNRFLEDIYTHNNFTFCLNLSDGFIKLPVKAIQVNSDNNIYKLDISFGNKGFVKVSPNAKVRYARNMLFCDKVCTIVYTVVNPDTLEIYHFMR